MFDKFPQYHIENSVSSFQCQSRQGRHFKPAIGNESLHEISNDNEDIVVNFATSKNLRVKSTMFPHCNIHKYIVCPQSPLGVLKNCGAQTN
jgi:hypothetical protein